MNIYISSSIRENINETIEIANQNNANIEICKFAESRVLDGDLDAFIDKYKKNFEKFNGQLSLHGVFYDLNVVSKDTRVKELSRYRFQQSFKVAKALDIKTIVFHSGYNGLVKSVAYHNKFINDQIEFWKEFIKQFEDANKTVVIENTYEPTPDVILNILKNVNSKALKACIDTGHVNINSDLTVFDWIIKMKDYLHHMHLHNNYGQYDEHNSLLKGSIDFKEVVKFLMDNKINPNLSLEIFTEKASLESVNLVKSVYNNINTCK